ncbi:hypothetical protein PSTG_19802, partial [Puccinia striiformis f. sp. tritici PST-78]
IRHCSSSETLPQMLQNFAFAFISTRASARRRTSTGSAASRWNAIRWAPFGPTPGSRPSSSIRSWTTPSYTGTAEPDRPAATRLVATTQGAQVSPEPTGEGAQRLCREGVDLVLRVAVGGHDQVAE